jgi:hypothetical protein
MEDIGILIESKILTREEQEIALFYFVGTFFIKFAPLFGYVMKILKSFKFNYQDHDFDIHIRLLDKLTIIEFSDEMQEKIRTSTTQDHFNKVIDPY